MRKLVLIALLLVLSVTKANAIELFSSSGGPCDHRTNINLTANGVLITGVAGKTIKICVIDIVSTVAEGIALVEGTGSTCGTSTLGVNGGPAAATGWPFDAKGGIVEGNGSAFVTWTSVTGNTLCLFKSSSGQVSGKITWTMNGGNFFAN